MMELAKRSHLLTPQALVATLAVLSLDLVGCGLRPVDADGYARLALTLDSTTVLVPYPAEWSPPTIDSGQRYTIAFWTGPTDAAYRVPARLSATLLPTTEGEQGLVSVCQGPLHEQVSLNILPGEKGDRAEPIATVATALGPGRMLTLHYVENFGGEINPGVTPRPVTQTDLCVPVARGKKVVVIEATATPGTQAAASRAMAAIKSKLGTTIGADCPSTGCHQGIPLFALPTGIIDGLGALALATGAYWLWRSSVLGVGLALLVRCGIALFGGILATLASGILEGPVLSLILGPPVNTPNDLATTVRFLCRNILGPGLVEESAILSVVYLGIWTFWPKLRHAGLGPTATYAYLAATGFALLEKTVLALVGTDSVSAIIVVFAILFHTAMASLWVQPLADWGMERGDLPAVANGVALAAIVHGVYDSLVALVGHATGTRGLETLLLFVFSLIFTLVLLFLKRQTIVAALRSLRAPTTLLG